MKSFGSGFNNFFVGLFSGLLLPIVIIMVLLFLTVDKITSFAENEAIAPLYQRGEQTLDKMDALLTTLDSKVDNANLQDVKLLAPLKDANLFPELKQIASTVSKLRDASDAEKQEMLENLKVKLKTTLQEKFPEDKAQQLADNLAGIADVLASKKEALLENNEQLLEKKDELVEQAQETKEQIQEKMEDVQQEN
ncbi:hypothetical protein [Vibrio algivorus]|uniref:Chromosome partitioning protein ParA n=1 Tax=Vibrio algivorus TaxID=1667024 RepID=A0ABQ6ELN9_9VIBR|nr:hypothetical protein [Vibrio algivorus]GLT13452.1 hypothetical protein GCM10007931_04260 [Vibrio algivorus]